MVRVCFSTFAPKSCCRTWTCCVASGPLRPIQDGFRKNTRQVLGVERLDDVGGGNEADYRRACFFYSLPSTFTAIDEGEDAGKYTLCSANCFYRAKRRTAGRDHV